MNIPKIDLNGHELTDGQSLTLEVALKSYHMVCKSFCNTEKDNQVFRNYMGRIEEILEIVEDD